MRGLLLTGQNQYGVVSHFLAGITADLHSLAVDTDMLCVESAESIQQGLPGLQPLETYTFIFSFNAVGLGDIAEGYNLRDVLPATPTYVFCVDHPIHLMDRFWGLPVTLLCVDKEHVAFARLCGMNAIYFAHAVSASLSNQYPISPLQEKNDCVLFPVSHIDTAYYRELLAPYWKRLGTVIEQCSTVTRFMQAIGVLPTKNRPAALSINADILRLCIMVDKYLRSKGRERCLSYFQEAGVSLTVIGRNSTRYQPIADAHNYHDALPFETLITEMSQARFVIHQSPGFDMGLHERVVYPLALGTPVVAVDTPFITRHIEHGVLTPDQLFAGLDDNEYNRLRLQARDDILCRHTWKQRLQEQLSITSLTASDADTTQ